ncbi:MAG TPA: response regulator transcription factor [Actinomycetes bacterium]|nr:response regulator transcription factor [Actinomycetes bacterium]
MVERSGRRATTATATAGRPERFSALVVLAAAPARQAVTRRLFALGAHDVAEATTLAEARTIARAGDPRDLAVVELGLVDGSGLALLDELRTAGWPHGVVITGSDDPSSVRAALSCGVRALLVSRPAPRPVAPLQVLGAKRAAHGLAGLSAREIEVLRLVSDGRTNRDVGEALGLSALTVKSHLARIARKLGTGDRAEMVAMAMRGGLIR